MPRTHAPSAYRCDVDSLETPIQTGENSCYPEVSVDLLAATPTAHRLEYVDWAEPFLTTGISIATGQATVPTEPGTGVAWDEAAIRQYAID